MSKDKNVKVKKGESEKDTSKEIEIRREKPFSLFQEMDRYMSRMMKQFDDYFEQPFRSLVPRFDESVLRTPLANVVEDEKAYNITAEIPGLDKNEIEISYYKGLLEIKGEAKEEKKEEIEGNIVRREYHSSKYYRAFNLPENVEEDRIDAQLDKGLLKIIVPKKDIDVKDKKKIQVK